MANVWKIGEWVTVDGWKGLVYRVCQDRLYVVDDEGDSLSYPFNTGDFSRVVKRLPNCTGWNWTEEATPPLQYSFGATWQDAKAAGVVDAAIEATRLLFIDEDQEETFNVRVRNGHAEWPITVKRTQRYEVVSSRADIKQEV